MDGMSKIFLCHLEFRHHRRLFHSTKQWTEGLSRLKIYRSILYLDDHIVPELSIEWYKFSISLLCTILIISTVDKGTPHYDTAIGFQRIGENIGAVNMCAAKILGPGLPFVRSMPTCR